jgi:large subunit ribosomal protein L19
MDLVKVLSEQQLKSDLPTLKIGDTVKVHAKIKEGNRERIQVFEGIIIAKKHAGVNQTVTVRRISYGVGVEKTFRYIPRTLLSSRLFAAVRFAVLSCTTCAAA